MRGITLISIMMFAVHASGITDHLSAFFKFLPTSQYDQLKPKIAQIIDTRTPSTRPISQQAISITSDILDAFYSIVASDQSHLKLSKRTVSFEESIRTNKDAATYGFMDVFELSASELKLYLEFMEGGGDSIVAAKSLIRSTLKRSNDELGPSPLGTKYLKQLDELEKLSLEEQRKMLSSLLLKSYNLVHPDKNAQNLEHKARELMQEYEPRIKQMRKSLSSDPGRDLLLSQNVYENIIHTVKIYENEAKWWFTPSQTKKWRKLKEQASHFANGASKKDLDNIREALEYKERGEEVPHSLKMNYWSRKLQDYTALVETEIELIDEYIYSIVRKKGHRLYDSQKWTSLQRHLEARYEELIAVQNFVISPDNNAQVNSAFARFQESNMYNLKKTGTYGAIGGLLFLAVLAWLKQGISEFKEPSLEADKVYNVDPNEFEHGRRHRDRNRNNEDANYDHGRRHRNRNRRGDSYYDEIPSWKQQNPYDQDDDFGRRRNKNE